MRDEFNVELLTLAQAAEMSGVNGRTTGLARRTAGAFDGRRLHPVLDDAVGRRDYSLL